jgi:predicted dehydrogenase
VSAADFAYLIVGLGGIGQRHARNLRTLGAKRIVGLRTGRGVLPVPADLGVESYNRLDDALAARPQVGFVCNPTSLHVDTARQLVEAGMDVLVEKPISHSLAGVDELIAKARQKNRVLGVAVPLRYHPLVQTAREWSRRGDLGAVRYIRASVGQYPPSWRPQYDYRSSYAVRRDLGGGCLRTFIHEIDMLLDLKGMPRIIEGVSGHFSSLETDAEDLAEILLGYDDCLGSVHIDYVQQSAVNSRYLQIVGEDAALWLDFAEPSLKLYTQAGVREAIRLENFDANRLHLDEVAEFIECVRTRASFRADGVAGKNALVCVLAGLKSSATGRRIELMAEEQGIGAASV